MPSYFISIIIPTYNRCELLGQTLLSICKQRISKAQFEILIIDDGSSDSTSEIVKSYKSRLDIKYFFQEDKGYRVASARNLGIKNAKGDIIIFIDSGMILSDNCIKAHIDAHGNHFNKVVIGYMMGLGLSGNKRDRDLLIETVNAMDASAAISYLISQQKCLDKRECVFDICNSNINNLPAPWVLFWTGNASVKKEGLIAAGAFDTNFDFRWGIEDVELGYRLFKNNHIFELSRSASAIHIPHSGDKQKKLQEEHFNKLYFHEKHNSIETKSLLACDTVSLNLLLHTNQNN